MAAKEQGKELGPVKDELLNMDFEVVASLLDEISKKKSPKREILNKFKQRVLLSKAKDGRKLDGEALHSIYRLILPELDKNRSNYGMKEAALADTIADALGIGKDSEHRQKLKLYRVTGSGRFKETVEEVVAPFVRKEGAPQSEADVVTIKKVNDMLDQIANVTGKDARTGKAKVLRTLLRHLTPPQVQWLVGILMKDLKVGISEKTVFESFHPDILDAFNVCCDLHKVFIKFAPYFPDKPFPRQETVPCSMTRTQLALTGANADTVFKKMKGAPFYIESKFDGERIQLHRDGDDIRYFSKNLIDHGPFETGRGFQAFNAAVKKQLNYAGVLGQRIILDGEMIVWNKRKGDFEDFGCIVSVMNAIRDNRGPDEEVKPDGSAPNFLVKDCEIHFMAFDILYRQDRSVMNMPLRERKKILDTTLGDPGDGTPLAGAKGRLNGVVGKIWKVILGTPWCVESTSKQDIVTSLQEKTSEGEEGIVVKNSESKCDKWIKLKPDYFKPEDDLDVLVLGAWKGTGELRGGKISEFLCGIARKPKFGPITEFLTFCKVGTGLNMQELERFRDIFEAKKAFVENKGKNSKPAWIVASNFSSKKTTPHFWVVSPEKSLALTVKADLRLIASREFATRASLRFPRVMRVRWDDMHWEDVLDDERLDTLINEGQQANIHGDSHTEKKRKRIKRLGEGDVPTSTTFEGLEFYFHGFKRAEISDLELKVQWASGRVISNVTPSTTHIICSLDEKPSSPVFQAAVKRVAASKAALANPDKHSIREFSVLTSAWVEDCLAQGELLEPEPKHVLYVPYGPDVAADNDRDQYGASFTAHLDEADVEALLGLIERRDEARKRMARAGGRTPGPADKPEKNAAKLLDLPPPDLSEIFPEDEEYFLGDGGAGGDGQAAEERVDWLVPELSLFRGVVASVLRGPRTGSAADDEATDDLVRLLQIQIRTHGGKVLPEVDSARSTHLVVVTPVGGAPPSFLDFVAQAASTPQGVASLRALRRRLGSAATYPKPLHVVEDAWVDETLGALNNRPSQAPADTGAAGPPPLQGSVDANDGAEGRDSALVRRPQRAPEAEHALALPEDAAGTIASALAEAGHDAGDDGPPSPVKGESAGGRRSNRGTPQKAAAPRPRAARRGRPKVGAGDGSDDEGADAPRAAGSKASASQAAKAQPPPTSPAPPAATAAASQQQLQASLAAVAEEDDDDPLMNLFNSRPAAPSLGASQQPTQATQPPPRAGPPQAAAAATVSGEDESLQAQASLEPAAAAGGDGGTLILASQQHPLSLTMSASQEGGATLGCGGGAGSSLAAASLGAAPPVGSSHARAGNSSGGGAGHPIPAGAPAAAASSAHPPTAPALAYPLGRGKQMVKEIKSNQEFLAELKRARKEQEAAAAKVQKTG